MSDNRIFLATTGKSLARAEYLAGTWQIETLLSGTRITCLAADPLKPPQLYAGTQGDGLLVSEDSGKTWRSAGLAGAPVRSLAISRHFPGTIFAGCKPVSLYVSQDSGGSWEELTGLRRARRWWWFSPAEPPEWDPFVMALTNSPTDPNVLMAGIELGGVLRSENGGRTWSKHRRGALLDCHSLTFHHSDGKWVYQGGAGLRSGAAYSRDGGYTWEQPREGLASKYGFTVAADPARPEVWYLSASAQPNLLRGEFTPPAHNDGQARAHIYRSVGGAAWEQLSGGLPEPLDYMAYALIPDLQKTGHLYAGLANGDVWHTQDYGDSWEQLPFNLGGIHHTMIMI
ncbi:MAG: hypothetical protein ISR58_00220 [Anaerolineales bacterium]|nr:hypothetical protein [Chloroflexota bacterium]MBL6979587.1 hypothetical protein [Anaerolineales bacterium]